MSNFKYLFAIILPLIAVFVISCGPQTTQQQTDPAATKYLPSVNKYCEKNNLKLLGYVGKTIIRSKDFSNSQLGREPVVYEWKVINKASKQNFFLWVGPVMPGLANVKPGIMLGEGRYELKGMKVEEQK